MTDQATSQTYNIKLPQAWPAEGCDQYNYVWLCVRWAGTHVHEENRFNSWLRLLTQSRYQEMIFAIQQIEKANEIIRKTRNTSAMGDKSFP